MSISSISGGQAAALSAGLSTSSAASALTSLASGSGNGVLVANVDLASSNVSASLQAMSNALGSIIDISA
jgi:hypothetical protein